MYCTVYCTDPFNLYLAYLYVLYCKLPLIYHIPCFVDEPLRGFVLIWGSNSWMDSFWTNTRTVLYVCCSFGMQAAPVVCIYLGTVYHLSSLVLDVCTVWKCTRRSVQTMSVYHSSSLKLHLCYQFLPGQGFHGSCLFIRVCMSNALTVASHRPSRFEFLSRDSIFCYAWTFVWVLIDSVDLNASNELEQAQIISV